MGREPRGESPYRSSPHALRILITSSTFPLRLDDANPRFVHDLAKALAAHARVTILAPDSPGAANREQMGGLDVRRFRYFPVRRLQNLALGRGMRDNLRSSWLARLQVPLFLIRQACATRNLARRLSIDVVNAHWLIPQGLSAGWARGRRRRFRLVIHVHGGDVSLLRILPLGRTLARHIIRRADMVFVVGNQLRDALDALLGFPSGAIIQSMGVDGTVFTHGKLNGGRVDGGPTIDAPFRDGFLLFVGRLIEIKGADYLIRALPRVVQHHSGIGLVVIGSGPEESLLRQEAERLSIGKSVLFAGRKSHQEIARYLSACRVAVVPSIIDSDGNAEGMPTVVVEALAAGARLVASSVDGIPDVVRNGENGWLCRYGDSDDLAEKILIALNDPDPSPIIDAALATARRYDWRQVALNYMRHLNSLFDHRSARQQP